MCVLSPVLHLSLVLSSGQLHGTVMTTVGVQRVRMGGIDGATLYILVKCKLKGKKTYMGSICVCVSSPVLHSISRRVVGVVTWHSGDWVCGHVWMVVTVNVVDVEVEIVTWHMIWSVSSLPNVYELLVST